MKHTPWHSAALRPPQADPPQPPRSPRMGTGRGAAAAQPIFSSSARVRAKGSPSGIEAGPEPLLVASAAQRSAGGGAVPGGASSRWEWLFPPAHGSAGLPRQRNKGEGTWGLLLVGQNGISLLNIIKLIGKGKTTPAPLLSMGSTRSSGGKRCWGKGYYGWKMIPGRVCARIVQLLISFRTNSKTSNNS